jgi:hypothetical protein
MDDLLNVIPPKWHTTALVLGIAAPYLTRAYHALRTGGGLRGVWNGIWFGTNAPKSDAADDKKTTS